MAADRSKPAHPDSELPAWRRPHANRLRAIRSRLRGYYGVPVAKPHHDPVAELVLTVLSQNTNDRNRDIAYSRLEEKLPTWEDVRAAPVAEIEAAIAPGGISKVKSARIKRILDRVATDPLPAGADPDGVWSRAREIDLDWMAVTPIVVSRDYLCTLPGVARKTAACVLLFAYGLPDIPVDTHVGRVGKRLGLFRERAAFEEMHDTILALTPADLAHETHVNLIQHGRRLCHARSPQCGVCPLREICPSASQIYNVTT
ncbi:MAG: DNA lyase [Thermoleophilia bacterium]|nr:DNA lyase [Thermoleophilia bacterium]